MTATNAAVVGDDVCAVAVTTLSLKQQNCRMMHSFDDLRQPLVHSPRVRE